MRKEEINANNGIITSTEKKYVEKLIYGFGYGGATLIINGIADSQTNPNKTASMPTGQRNWYMANYKQYLSRYTRMLVLRDDASTARPYMQLPETWYDQTSSNFYTDKLYFVYDLPGNLVYWNGEQIAMKIVPVEAGELVCGEYIVFLSSPGWYIAEIALNNFLHHWRIVAAPIRFYKKIWNKLSV